MYLWESGSRRICGCFFAYVCPEIQEIKEEKQNEKKIHVSLLLAVSMTCSMTAATGAVAFASDDTATEESADDATADDADAADTEEASDDTTEHLMMIRKQQTKLVP